LKKRYRAEKRFRLYGIGSIVIGMLALLLLFTEIIGKGIGAFHQNYMQVEVTFDAEELGIDPDVFTRWDEASSRKQNYSREELDQLKQERDSALTTANYTAVIRDGLLKRFPDVKSRNDKRALYGLVSIGASYALRDMLREDSSLLGSTHTLWL